MTHQDGQPSVLQPSEVFNPEFREGAVRAFGADGAWLLLSIAWYGWRVQYDLACSLLTGSRPDAGAEVKPVRIGVEFDIVRDLQVQSDVFAASEQFATLLRAARVRGHRRR